MNFFFFFFFFFFDEAFPERIAAAMEKNEIGVEQLATKMGVATVTIERWLDGKYKPRYTNLIKLADALDVSERYLCGKDA